MYSTSSPYLRSPEKSLRDNDYARRCEWHLETVVHVDELLNAMFPYVLEVLLGLLPGQWGRNPQEPHPRRCSDLSRGCWLVEELGRIDFF